MINHHYLRYQQSQLHYISTGNGNRPLLFFHGFGQDHSVYLPLVRNLSAEYKLFLFDLYFHGDSVWAFGEQPLEKSHWKDTINQFLEEWQIKKFSVAGFSLGGKFALSTLESFPDRCDGIFLLAPDGIKTSFWYSLATYPLVFRKLFKSLINDHTRFTSIARALNKMNIVDKGLIRFADYQMNSEAKRRRVYFSWVVFRHLRFKPGKLAALINKHGIRTVIVVGKYDNVINPKNIRPFADLIQNSRFHVVEAGHSSLLTSEIFHLHLKMLQ